LLEFHSVTEYNCILPLLVRFRGIPNIDRLVELTDAITQGFSRRLLFADHAISEHEGWPAWHKIHAAPKLIFTGDPLDQDLQKRVAESIEAGIARALTAQAATASPALPFVPAQYHPPPKRIAPVRQAVAKKTLDVPWRVRIKVNFHIKPREFFTIRKNLPSLRPMEDEVDPMEAYYPLLDTRQPAVAWVVETLREYEFVTLADEVFHRFAVSRTSNEFVWSVAGWSNLRKPIVQADQDGQIARRVPEFTTRGFSESRPGPGDGETQLILRPGAWIFAVFLPLPRLKLDDLVVLETPQTIDVPLSEASILIAPEVFKTEVGLDLAQIEKEAPDCTVTVVAEVFTVRRKVHERALAALFEQYRRHTQGVRRLGQILPLLGPAFQQIGPTLGPFLQGLANTNPAKQHGKIENGFWQPGTRGVNITPLFLNDFVDRVLRKANAALISSQADEVQRILTLKNTIWSVDRDPALERFINFYWGRLDTPKLFGFLLDELQRRGALDAFLNAVRSLPWWDTYLKRRVLAQAAGSAYATDPRIIAWVHEIETLARSTWKGRYDVDAQEIWIDGDPTVSAYRRHVPRTRETATPERAGR